MATFDNLDLVRTSVEYRDILATETNPNYDLATRTFSFADIELLDGIPAQDQLEIERIFPVNTLGSSKYEGVQLTIADRRLMFKLPKQWYTVDIINKTITMKDIANSASDEFVPAPAANTGPYYDINTGTSRTFKLLAASTPPGQNQTIIIPGLAANDDVIIRRRTVSTEKVVNFAPGSRLTSGQLNLQVSQLVNLLQELMWKVDQEFILKFDESAVDGPFLGNKDLDMGSFSIINMGMPGVDGNAFPPNAQAEPEDIDRIGRMAVNKYFLQNVYTDYISNTVIANWDAGGRSGALVTRLAGFDSSLAAKQPLNTNLTTLQGTTNASGLVTLSNSTNLALVTAIGALASGSNGFIKKSGASTVTLDTNTYLTGNQSISLSGAVSGSGTTAITTTLGSGVVGNSNLAANAVTNDKITNGTIANAKLANSTISGIALGSTLATLTRGTYLTGSDYTGGTATTWAVDAATANTASKVVARDASGNFAAGTITAALLGNASTASTLQTARNISITGGATASAVSFNGGADVALNVTALNATNLTAGTLDVARIASGAITDDKLAQIATAGKINLTALPTGIPDANLSNTTVTAGTYGNTSLNVSQLTVNAQGRLTAASNRDLSSAVVSSIQANAPFLSSGVFTADNKRITNLAAPTTSLDAINKNYVDSNFLKVTVTNTWDALAKRLSNLAVPINANDAATKEFVEGLQLFGTAQTDPQLFEYTSLSGTVDGSHTRYDLTIDTLTTTNQSMLIVYDNINNIYGPGSNAASSYKFYLNIVGANKTLKVWVPTASTQPTSIRVRNFGVSRITQANLATAGAVGLAGFPVDGGLAVADGFVTANKSDSVASTNSNQMATSAAVKTAYDAAVAAQTTANTGVTNAATAQTTADTALTNANAAQATANAALPAAGGTITGNLVVNGTTTLGDTSADTVTFNGTAISTPNGLNFDSNTLVIDHTNNRIGVGTAAPAVLLHVNTAATGNTNVIRLQNGSGYVEIGPTNSSYTHFYSDRPAYYFNKPITVTGDTNYTISSYQTADLKLATNGNTKVVVFDNGNVGIGITTAITDKLHVVGSILATTSLKVNGSTSGTASLTAPAIAGTNAYVLPTTAGTLVGSGDIGTVTNTMLAGSITDAKLSTITAANKVSLAALDIDGGTDIGADLADADLLIVDDGGAGTNRKSAVTRIPTYVFTKVSGDITINSSGVAAVAANSVALGTDTTGNYVATITGTANQITVGNSGAENAAVTLALPQDINTTSNPTFAGATLGTTRVGVTTDNEIDTTSGNLILDSTSGTVQVDDNLEVTGNISLKSADANKLEVLNATGDEGFSLERVTVDATGSANSGDLIIRLTQPGSETESRNAFLLLGSETPSNTNRIATITDINSLDLSNYVTTSSFNSTLDGYMLKAGSLSAGVVQTIGTSDTNSFKIKTNNTDRVTIASGGDVTLANNLTVSGLINSFILENMCAETKTNYLSIGATSQIGSIAILSIGSALGGVTGGNGQNYKYQFGNSTSVTNNNTIQVLVSAPGSTGMQSLVAILNGGVTWSRPVNTTYIRPSAGTWKACWLCIHDADNDAGSKLGMLYIAIRTA